MSIKRETVELLAPAGTWDALQASVEAGADAVYLGGKHFNMRMHKRDANFDDETLKKAVEYVHENGRKLYVTINNLISYDELPILRRYLEFLSEIRPDAILAQDFAILKLAGELKIDIPLHASIMMNVHNEETAFKLKEYGVTRAVVSREATLDELALFKERTGIETEYFIHGDMCICESGQCIHSGVVFGQSGNRGRCLKPCRWPYAIIDEDTKEKPEDKKGHYKLAMKDMCMYRNIPELIRAGVSSFKIEGRMRPADFVRRIVSTYRKAIDDYIKDPMGYKIDENEWQKLYENRARDFTTCFALGKPGADVVGYGGEREPRFFSVAPKEAGFDDEAILSQPPIKTRSASPKLSVRVKNFDAAKAAIESGADIIYAGGEAFLPDAPLKLSDYEKIISLGKEKGVKIVIRAPRTTTRRECEELKDFFPQISELKADGVQVGNLGALEIAKKFAKLPVYADFSFNLFNPVAADFLRENGAEMATSSLELSFSQLKDMAENTELPIETVIHGAYESMICDHNFAEMSLENPDTLNRRYALLDEANEAHPIRADQYGRNHIYFAKDLCLYPYLEKFQGVAALRIEAHTYDEELVKTLVKLYREGIDALKAGETEFKKEDLKDIIAKSPRELGVGSYKFKRSKDSV